MFGVGCSTDPWLLSPVQTIPSLKTAEMAELEPCSECVP